MALMLLHNGPPHSPTNCSFCRTVPTENCLDCKLCCPVFLSSNDNVEIKLDLVLSCRVVSIPAAGNNKNGRLGDGRTSGIKTVVTRPRKILGGGSYEDICAKGSHSCGLRNDSTVYCWGGNTDGEIGNGKKSANVSTPSQVPGNWKQVACGLRFTCGISSKNQALCWGSLRGGGSAMVNTVLGPKPVVVGSGTWLQISGGMQHACGIKSDRKGYCFGLGFHGQLGNGKRTDCSYKKPCLVSGGHTWVEISAGEYNTCGVTTKGEVRLYTVAILY
jgi:alpha-tubulin suppressor-like RCC1 family protein